MEFDFLFKRNESISRFLNGLRSLALKNTSSDRLQAEVEAYVEKRLPSSTCSCSFSSDCYSYALYYRQYVFYENSIRTFQSF